MVSRVLILLKARTSKLSVDLPKVGRIAGRTMRVDYPFLCRRFAHQQPFLHSMNWNYSSNFVVNAYWKRKRSESLKSLYHSEVNIRVSPELLFAQILLLTDLQSSSAPSLCRSEFFDNLLDLLVEALFFFRLNAHRDLGCWKEYARQWLGAAVPQSAWRRKDD